MGVQYMKRHLIIWAILTGLCLAWLYPHRNELSLYWREWSSFQRHFAYGNEGKFGLRQPFLSRSVAQQDSEAAAIVDLIMQDPSREDFQDIEYIAEQMMKFPTNQYFLYDLACRCALRTYIDPQIIDKIADRLIELDPNNGRYYFLKAWAVFYDWGDNRLEKSLDYLEKSYSCPTRSDPYEAYKERTYRLMESEKSTVFFSNRILSWSSENRWLQARFIRDILTCTQDLIVNSQSDRAMQIHDRLQRLAENNIPQTIKTFRDYPVLTFSMSFYGLPQETPQAVELKWMKLDPQRARQNRLQMLTWKQWNTQVQSDRTASARQTLPHFKMIAKDFLPPAAHGFQMTIASGFILLFFFVVGFILKMQRVSISWLVFAVMLLVFLGYFILCRFMDYQIIHEPICGDHHYTFDCVSDVNYNFPSTTIISSLR
jgi:hypothetical protein